MSKVKELNAVLPRLRILTGPLCSLSLVHCPALISELRERLGALSGRQNTQLLYPCFLSVGLVFSECGFVAEGWC